MAPRLRVVSYNIHKGFSTGNRRFVLKRIKESIKESQADLVLLQEVLGHHDEHSSKLEDWPTSSQFEFLADKVWKHYAYGKNAVYTEGHHGNAILSKYPISFWENEDVSLSKLERRGLLHAAIEIPKIRDPLHVICVHLGLFENDRQSQIRSLDRRIARMVPRHSPILVGGDFNDWRQKVSPVIRRDLGLEEAFLTQHGEHAKTFPSWMPVLRLDRLYYRGVRCVSARTASGRNWRSLSDHLPLIAEFDL